MRGEGSRRAGSGASLGDAGVAAGVATTACVATLDVAVAASEARVAPLHAVACCDVAAAWLDPEQHACFAKPEWRIALAERADFSWQHGAAVAQSGPTSNNAVHSARFNMTGA
ncbi:MAG TPA: hypothetical protein VL332_13100 [Candidatus Saccharimonadaceae bacterium]|jgi:hypothetical protein|nr:hypothetical protein [Candidatus Saccharimonadaceae bacterium]